MSSCHCEQIVLGAFTESGLRRQQRVENIIPANLASAVRLAKFEVSPIFFWSCPSHWLRANQQPSSPVFRVDWYYDGKLNADWLRAEILLGFVRLLRHGQYQKSGFQWESSWPFPGGPATQRSCPAGKLALASVIIPRLWWCWPRTVIWIFYQLAWLSELTCHPVKVRLALVVSNAAHQKRHTFFWLMLAVAEESGQPNHIATLSWTSGFKLTSYLENRRVCLLFKHIFVIVCWTVLIHNVVANIPSSALCFRPTAQYHQSKFKM